MNDYGFDKVYKQDLFVPNWKRGDKEIARIIDSNEDLSVLALGMSVATPKDGIRAEIIESSFRTRKNTKRKTSSFGKIRN